VKLRERKVSERQSDTSTITALISPKGTEPLEGVVRLSTRGFRSTLAWSVDTRRPWPDPLRADRVGRVVALDAAGREHRGAPWKLRPAKGHRAPIWFCDSGVSRARYAGGCSNTSIFGWMRSIHLDCRVPERPRRQSLRARARLLGGRSGEWRRRMSDRGRGSKSAC
jgi:hypothetical protein